MKIPDVNKRARQLGFRDLASNSPDSLNRWLRDEHSLLVVVDMKDNSKYEFHITFMDNPTTSYGINEDFHTYDEALEVGMDTAMDFIT